MDDPSFTANPFASLSSLDVGVKLWPLLTKKIEVEEITLRDPVITVIKSKAGVTNVSTIGPKHLFLPTAGSLSLHNSRAIRWKPSHSGCRPSVDRRRHGGLPRPPQQRRKRNIEFKILCWPLKSVHLGETPTIHLSATTLPHNLPVTLDGSFGPLVQALEIKQYQFLWQSEEWFSHCMAHCLEGNWMRS